MTSRVVFDENGRVGQVRVAKFAYLGIQIGRQPPQLGSRMLDVLDRFLTGLNGSPSGDEFAHCLIGLVRKLENLPLELLGLQARLQFLLKKLYRFFIPFGQTKIVRLDRQNRTLRKGLGKSLPRFLHAGEIALQPRIGLARPARVVAQLNKQPQRLVEVPRLLLHRREIGSSLLLLGLLLKLLNIGQDRNELLGEADLPGRDMP